MTSEWEKHFVDSCGRWVEWSNFAVFAPTRFWLFEGTLCCRGQGNNSNFWHSVFNGNLFIWHSVNPHLGQGSGLISGRGLVYLSKGSSFSWKGLFLRQDFLFLILVRSSRLWNVSFVLKQNWYENNSVQGPSPMSCLCCEVQTEKLCRRNRWLGLEWCTIVWTWRAADPEDRSGGATWARAGASPTVWLINIWCKTSLDPCIIPRQRGKKKKRWQMEIQKDRKKKKRNPAKPLNCSSPRWLLCSKAAWWPSGWVRTRGSERKKEGTHIL